MGNSCEIVTVLLTMKLIICLNDFVCHNDDVSRSEWPDAKKINRKYKISKGFDMLSAFLSISERNFLFGALTSSDIRLLRRVSNKPHYVSHLM